MFTLLRSLVFNQWFFYLLTSISHSGFSKLPILFHADLHHRRSSTSTDLLPGCIFDTFDNNQWLSLRGGLAQYRPWDLEATYGDFRWRNLRHEFRTASWMQIFWEGSTNKPMGNLLFLWWGEACMGRSSLFHRFFCQETKRFSHSRCHEVLSQKESFGCHVLLGGLLV